MLTCPQSAEKREDTNQHAVADKDARRCQRKLILTGTLQQMLASMKLPLRYREVRCSKWIRNIIERTEEVHSLERLVAIYYCYTKMHSLFFSLSLFHSIHQCFTISFSMSVFSHSSSIFLTILQCSILEFLSIFSALYYFSYSFFSFFLFFSISISFSPFFLISISAAPFYSFSTTIHESIARLNLSAARVIEQQWAIGSMSPFVLPVGGLACQIQEEK